jgi:catechol 2,3-dioxygenase-like lactoylglutathione lyase family enzyme
MSKALPPRPDIAWLKKAAKERLAELRAHEPDARLHQAQLDIARDYGFASWRALKAHVDTLSLDSEIIAATLEGDAGRLAQLLDEHPAKIGVTGGQWNRPLLHLAADRGHLACVELLLARGIPLDQRDAFDNATALHWAAQGGRLDVVKRLIAAGADIDGEGDEHQAGVIGWATIFGPIHAHVADFLLARGAHPTIFSAVALGRTDLVRTLIARDPRLISAQMSRFESRRMPLHLAVITDKPDMVELLLELGVNPASQDDRGNTPLNYASAKTDPRIAAALIAAGARPSEHSANRFESAVPILSVKNVPASIAYYVDKLGFTKEWDWGSPPTFACVYRDNVRIFFCQDAQGAPGMWVSVFVHDVDALHEDYKRRGATIRQAPTNFPWGVREMNVEDPDGHRLRLGSDATGPWEGTPLAPSS